jgi:hypothetical protein
MWWSQGGRNDRTAQARITLDKPRLHARKPTPAPVRLPSHTHTHTHTHTYTLSLTHTTHTHTHTHTHTKHTHTRARAHAEVCNTYCFFTATMTSWTRFIFTLYVHCCKWNWREENFFTFCTTSSIENQSVIFVAVLWVTSNERELVFWMWERSPKGRSSVP